MTGCYQLENTISTFSHLNYRNGKLSLYGTPLDECTDITETPFFCYSSQRIKENIQFIKAISSGQQAYFFPVKTASQETVLTEIAKHADGAIISSEAEYAKALNAGFEKFIVTGMGNSELAYEIHKLKQLEFFSTASINDVRYLNQYAKGAQEKAPIGIFMNTSGSFSSREIGLRDEDELDNFAQKCLLFKGIEIVSLHTRTEYRQKDVTKIIEAAKKLQYFSERLESQLGIKINTLDLGGGLETRARLSQEQESEIRDELRLLSESVSNERKIIFEFGQFIVGDAGFAVSTLVDFKKYKGNINWIALDIGTNSLIPLERAFFIVVPLNLPKNEVVTECRDSTINYAGKIPECAIVDAQLKIGDKYVVLDAGAYTLSLASDYVMPIPRIVLL